MIAAVAATAMQDQKRNRLSNPPTLAATPTKIATMYKQAALIRNPPYLRLRPARRKGYDESAYVSSKSPGHRAGLFVFSRLF